MQPRKDNQAVAATRPGSVENMTGRGLTIVAITVALAAATAGCISDTGGNNSTGPCGNGVLNAGE
jgi:hypothetical protein